MVDRKIRFVLCAFFFLCSVSPLQAQQVFHAPSVNGVRIDWCLNWAAACGKPAADRFCQNNGFTAAKHFEIAQKVGPTKVLGTGQDCGPNCDGFKMIECEKASDPNARLRPDLRVPDIGKQLPSGASLYYMAGDTTQTANFAAKGRSMSFYWNVGKVANAQGAMWQVLYAGAESSNARSGFAASGKGSGVQGSFVVDFASIPRPHGRLLSNQPLWSVRVIPVNSSGTVVGQPSNIILVFDQSAPSSGPDFQIGGQWYTKPGIQIRMTRFESVPYRYEDHWPSGCEPYKGAGNQQTPWGWAAGAVGDAFDWTSEAYQDAQNFVVQGVVTIFPFVPPEVAKFALQAALTSCGIPPSIPNLDQMMSSGADYLASQMVDQLAAQVPAGSELAQLGKEELRKKLQQETRDSILATAKKIREARASKSKYCIGMEYPPVLKITIRNDSPQTYQDFQIRLEVDDVSVPNQPGVQAYLLKPLDDYLLRPFSPLGIDRLDPGESITIPVDLFSHSNYKAVPEDPTTSYSEKDVYHWMSLYRLAHFSFTVSGGRTIKYRALKENGPHSEEQFVEDGMGFFFKSPKRPWMDDPFVNP